MSDKFKGYDPLFEAITPDTLRKSYLLVSDGTGTELRVYLTDEAFHITDYDLLHALHTQIHVPERVLDIEARTQDGYGLYAAVMDAYEMIAGEVGEVHNEFLFGIYALAYMIGDKIKNHHENYMLKIKLVVPGTGECDLFLPECVQHVPADMLVGNFLYTIDNPLYMFEIGLRRGMYPDITEDDVDSIRKSYEVSAYYFGSQPSCSLFVLAMGILSMMNSHLLMEENMDTLCFSDMTCHHPANGKPSPKNPNPNDFGGFTFK